MGYKSKKMINGVVERQPKNGQKKTDRNPNGAGRPAGKYKTRKDELIDRIQHLAFEHWGIEEWTPFDYAVRIASSPTDFVPMLDRDGKEIMEEDDAGNRVAVLEKIDPAFRLNCSKFIAEYTYPKLKSVELTAANMGGAFSVNMNVNVAGGKDLSEKAAHFVNEIDEATD